MTSVFEQRSRQGRVSTFRIAVDDGCRHVAWGEFDAIGTPAFWIDQACRLARNLEGEIDQWSSRSTEEELVFCLLGGFGVSAEAAEVAHRAVLPIVKSTPMGQPVDPSELKAVLDSPLADGRRYRFPNQRSERIAQAVDLLREMPTAASSLELRAQLLSLPGVGPKTAAWIVRNCKGSDEVAIIDIWLIRAMVRSGVFLEHWTAARHYPSMESAFLQYAEAGGVRASVLDLCIWKVARILFPALPTFD